jgi:hypothetical protein
VKNFLYFCFRLVLFAWRVTLVSWDHQVFRCDSIAGPETVGDTPRRRAIHHRVAGSRARIAAMGNRNSVADAGRRARRRPDGAAYRDNEGVAAGGGGTTTEARQGLQDRWLMRVAISRSVSPGSLSSQRSVSSFAIATALDVCKPALANACFACSCFCTRFAVPVRIFPTVVLPSAIRICSSARERRNRRRSRDRDKRAPTSRCIVVQAEPLRSPRPVRPARRASPPGCSRAGLPLLPTRNEANDSRRNKWSGSKNSLDETTIRPIRKNSPSYIGLECSSGHDDARWQQQAS